MKMKKLIPKNLKLSSKIKSVDFEKIRDIWLVKDYNEDALWIILMLMFLGGDEMIFKLKLKNQEEKEYTQILTVFTANNDDTGEKLLTVVTSGKSECYSMSDVEDFEVIGCGKCN